MGRDVHAEAIVRKAKDTQVPRGDRAVEAVKSIVREYYDESMLSDVVYDENEGGLSTTPVGRGSETKGKITVGKYFIEHIDAFARRVLQVGHELQHVQQHRDGMGGHRGQDKREFLAHSWGALEPAKSGTGHLPDAQRRDMIDFALGYYNCLGEDDQRGFAEKKGRIAETTRGRERNSWKRLYAATNSMPTGELAKACSPVSEGGAQFCLAGACRRTRGMEVTSPRVV